MRRIRDMAKMFFWVGVVEMLVAMVWWSNADVPDVHVYGVFGAGIGAASILAGAAFYLLATHKEKEQPLCQPRNTSSWTQPRRWTPPGG